MAAEDSYKPLTLEQPDFWIVPMTTNHESALATNTPMEDDTSGLSEVASSLTNSQQVEDAEAPADASSTGIKRELESPGTEQSPKTKTRRRRGDAEPDYSGMTREKVKSSKRTGQACDRCKLRKLRCDAEPEGCWQCSYVSHPCQVTDRVTGETFRRGEASQLKAENEGLKARVSELEGAIQQLRAENVSLHAQIFYHELMQGEASSPNTEADSKSPALEETPEGGSPATGES